MRMVWLPMACNRPILVCLSAFVSSHHLVRKFTSRRAIAATFLRNQNIDYRYARYRHYSKLQQSDVKPKQTRSYKFYILSVISALISLHLVSLICRKKFKKKNVREKYKDNYSIHQDPFCKGSSGTLLKMGKFWLPSEFFKDPKKLQEIKGFTFCDDDILVASFPKSGTTWVQEIVHQILHGSQVSEDTTIEERFPYIEYVYPGLRELAKSAHPHYIKTHLPYELLPEDIQNGHGKVIYIARNVKDVSVSFFHFIKMLTITKYSGEFDNFLSSFVEGKVPYGPWSEHVLQYWDRRDQENVLFITYEDLHKKPVSVIKQISSFLGRPIGDKEAIAIAYHCSFRQMESNPLVNYSWWDDLGIRDKKGSAFMRKGKVGDWENYYTPAMVKQVHESCVEPTQKKGLDMKDKI